MTDNLMNFKILEHGEFGEIRTMIDDEGTPMLCALDVAKALGYSRPRDAIVRHTKGALKQRTLTNGGMQELPFIYEPDLYRLLIKSKLPSAREFERWVFEDVLPSLRKYGMYATDEVLNNDEKLTEMKEQIKAERKATRLQKTKCTELRKSNKELLCCVEELHMTTIHQAIDIEVLEEIVEENQEKIDYAQIIMGSDLDMTPTQIAADYGISAIRLNNLLHEAGLQRKVNGQWVLYRKYMNCGYTNSFTGYLEQHDHYYVQTRWTQLGRLKIHDIMCQAGIKPICELGGQYE